VKLPRNPAKLAQVLQRTHQHNIATCNLQPVTAMNIHSLPVIVSNTAPSPANEPDERLTDDCEGKARLDGSTVGPTGIKSVALPIFLQVLLQLQCTLLVVLYPVTCSVQVLSCNFYLSS